MVVSCARNPRRLDRATIERARERMDEARDRVLAGALSAADGSPSTPSTSPSPSESASASAPADLRDRSPFLRPISVISSSLSLDWLLLLCSSPRPGSLVSSGGKESFSGSCDVVVIFLPLLMSLFRRVGADVDTTGGRARELNARRKSSHSDSTKPPWYDRERER